MGWRGGGERGAGEEREKKRLEGKCSPKFGSHNQFFSRNQPLRLYVLPLVLTLGQAVFGLHSATSCGTHIDRFLFLSTHLAPPSLEHIQTHTQYSYQRTPSPQQWSLDGHPSLCICDVYLVASNFVFLSLCFFFSSLINSDHISPSIHPLPTPSLTPSHTRTQWSREPQLASIPMVEGETGDTTTTTTTSSNLNWYVTFCFFYFPRLHLQQSLWTQSLLAKMPTNMYFILCIGSNSRASLELSPTFSKSH